MQQPQPIATVLSTPAVTVSAPIKSSPVVLDAKALLQVAGGVSVTSPHGGW